jgi:hypothetical protein
MTVAHAPSNWRVYVLDPEAATDLDAISETIRLVLDEALANGPASIDLRGLRPEAVEGEHLAAVLQALFSWRHQVPGWHAAYGVARQALGDDADDALYGL